MNQQNWTSSYLCHSGSEKVEVSWVFEKKKGGKLKKSDQFQEGQGATNNGEKTGLKDYIL